MDLLSNAVEAEYFESGATRLNAWSTSLELTREHFLFGTGPAGYAAYYMTYIPYSAMATHNNYIDILAQTGVIGSGILRLVFLRPYLAKFPGIASCSGTKGFYEVRSKCCICGPLGMCLYDGFW